MPTKLLVSVSQQKLPKLERIDTYWGKIGSIKDDSDHLKYLQLFALVKYVSCISHSNSVTERGFSINKRLLDIHGNSTLNDTILALRMVKNHISSVEGIMNVSTRERERERERERAVESEQGKGSCKS